MRQSVSGVTKGVYLVDNEAHSLDEILADDNGVYTYNGCPANTMHYSDGVCSTAHCKDKIF